MPETTTDPTAAEIAREYFDRYPGLLHILRLGHATEETLGHAATLVRAALAAAPADCDLGERIASAIERDEEEQHDALDREGPQPGHDYLRGYRTAVAACAEIAREVAGRSVSPDDAHTETVTEWRVVFANGLTDEFETERGARDWADHWRAQRAVSRVESRTVTTSRRESEWKATDQ